MIEQDYRDMLQTLSEGSVHRRFDPYLDIDWDAPEMRMDPKDPRWVLSEHTDPLGAHPWYRALPLERRIDIGRWRMANVQKVGLSFESVLIRGMLQYVMRLPNDSAEFRYCLHEMTEECNHIQMFQEFVNRTGADVPGMRALYRNTMATWSLFAKWPVVFFIGILAGEEPIDHIQKNLIREGKDCPPAMLRVMEIHIAEEARHISFAHRFLREHVARLGRIERGITSIVYPLVMRWLGGAIVVPPPEFAKRFDIPREVMREAFWKAPKSRAMLRECFNDVRMLADQLELMNPVSRAVWRWCGIDGPSSRFRGEPHRPARNAA
ncbi:para-aminobenzoate N-oxygenase AurF [Actinocorallia herbida]|uniref:Para-aminobenzoate N-oxygenase AurF n=1 Tax=Actinocorallia herbida TaxID=58109 RepID=A0A3N1D5C3_9ACTN|nr:diiron oxygenase [Actinocorallia herbida]ROO88690.1 para-aminobenzoate N-oxygenase AurF [Actinocorallia herbida]